jgi:DNA mismatch repair ATPase MutS
VDSVICERGKTVLRFRTVYQELVDLLERHGFTFFTSPLPAMGTEREAAAHALLHPTYFKIAWKYLGALEVIMRLTHAEGIHPVKWVSSSKPVFRAQHTFDFHVSEEKRRHCTVNLEWNRRHALLTGPNKGGKSTVLRALSATALLAHTYGCGFGYLVATPFVRQYVCLKPDDLPGTVSRFEREIQFTASTLRPVNGNILVFIDELYHSTNPPDAMRSCEIYGAQLWAMENAVSVISTHLFDWVEKSPSNIKRLCCPATVSGETVEFSYALEKGVCKVSSVDMLLRREGLLPPVHVGVTESA